MLVIGVDYANAPATYTPSQIQPLVFGSSNSVLDYYRDVSYSTVTIATATESSGTSNDGFIGWLRLSGNHPNTGENINAANQQIAKDSIIAADPYINYASYDANGDGIISPEELSIIIIVAGYEAAYGGSYSPSVWAHYWTMYSVGYPSVDNKTIYAYAEFGEKHGDHLATIGVMVHELGHLLFSLPDLYDTDLSNGDSFGVGNFDLMGTGGWGAPIGAYPGSSPTLLSAWSKEYLTWGTVNTISSNQTFYLPKSDGNSSSVFRINTSDSNQYFLVENRQFSGYDIGFQRTTGSYGPRQFSGYDIGFQGHGGIAIYHIDKLKTDAGISSNEVNADETDKGVDVEEANEGSLGYSMLDTYTYSANTNMFFFSGNNTSFTDSTTPNSKLKNGNSTNISITSISTYGDTMNATVALATTPTPTPTPATPTATATKTPIPTATPTPAPCDVATSISAYVGATVVTETTIVKGNSETITVRVTGSNGCSVSGATVKATSTDKSLVAFDPKSATTNALGVAQFTVTGKGKGSAKVTFKESTAGMKTKVKVKVE